MKQMQKSFTSLSDVIGNLVDDKVGIIRSVKEMPRQAGNPEFFHFYSQACDTTSLYGRKNFGRAGGASSDRGVAMCKAIGEAIERYCSACFVQDQLPFATYEDAPFSCIAPRDFALYGKEQYAQTDFPYVPFHENTLVRWSPTHDLTTGLTRFVPAAMVYLPYYYDLDQGESPIVQPISTGLACHGSYADAAISGLCEVIERDAVTITWQAKLCMPQIDLVTLSKSNQNLVAQFRRTGGRITLFNITMDFGIPTVFAILQESQSDLPAVAVAASTDLDPGRAVQKSLEELAHTRQFARYLKMTMQIIPPDAQYKNVRHQDDHIRFYCEEENAHLADFLQQFKKAMDFRQLENLSSGDSERDLDLLVEKIGRRNYRALIADITTSDIASVGLIVVRAIIPGLHPLFMGHAFRALGGYRLWNIPQQLGHSGISALCGDNPAPHPYP